MSLAAGYLAPYEFFAPIGGRWNGEVIASALL